MRTSLFPFFALIILVSLNLTGCKLADLRTETAKQTSNESKGRQLLKEMGKAHGIENWKNVNTYQVTFEDVFYGMIGKQASPTKDDSLRMQLSYHNETMDGNILFQSGKRNGELWGYVGGETYVKKAESPVKFKKHKNAKFWIPTYQYFIEFPNRIQSATAVNYAGEKKVNGIDCEGVIASWNTVEPQKHLDQYLIWLDKTAKRIVKVEYTIRDAYKFLVGAASFEDFKTVNGIIFPQKMPVTSTLTKNGNLHEMRLIDIQFNPKENLLYH